MSKIVVNNINLNAEYGTQVPTFGCRAWVNFDASNTFVSGSETRCTLLGSGNISKVVRRFATNNYQYDVYFTTAMPHTNYAAVFGGVAKAGTSNSYTPEPSEYTPGNNSAQTRQRSTSMITVWLNLSGVLSESISMAIFC